MITFPTASQRYSFGDLQLPRKEKNSRLKKQNATKKVQASHIEKSTTKENLTNSSHLARDKLSQILDKKKPQER